MKGDFAVLVLAVISVCVHVCNADWEMLQCRLGCECGLCCAGFGLAVGLDSFDLGLVCNADCWSVSGATSGTPVLECVWRGCGKVTRYT